MKRWAIKHIPTDRFYCEDEGGSYLVDGDDNIISWGKKEGAEYCMDNILDMADDNGGLLFTEMGEYPTDEFEIVEV